MPGMPGRSPVRGNPAMNGDADDRGMPEDDFSDERLREVYGFFSGEIFLSGLVMKCIWVVQG
jgi:hypothetical protein